MFLHGPSNITAKNETNHDKDSFMPIAEQLYTNTVVLLCIVGLVGNMTGIALIQSHEKLKRLHSNVYLSALAFSSSAFLLIWLFIWVEPFFDSFQIYQRSIIGCKVLTWLSSSADYCCAWIIVTTSVDRFTMLMYAKLRYRLWTLQRSKMLAMVVVVVSLVANSWLLLVAGFEEYEGQHGCGVATGWMSTYEIMSVFETMTGLVVPAVIICLTNIAIIWKLRAHAKQQRTGSHVRFRDESRSGARLTSSIENGPVLAKSCSELQPTSVTCTTQPTRNALGASNTLDTRYSQTDSGATANTSTAPSQIYTGASSATTRSDRKARVRRSDVQLTKTLVTVSVVFVLLNLPNYLSRLFLDGSTALQQYVSLVAFLLYHSHHAVLFYLYIFNSAQMRKQLVPSALKLLECYCLKTVPEFGHNTGSAAVQL